MRSGLTWIPPGDPHPPQGSPSLAEQPQWADVETPEGGMAATRNNPGRSKKRGSAIGTEVHAVTGSRCWDPDTRATSLRSHSCLLARQGLELQWAVVFPQPLPQAWT